VCEENFDVLGCLCDNIWLEHLLKFGLSYIVLEILLSFYQFLILCSPLFIVYFVSVECFTCNIKFYFELHEFEILKHRKTRYPNFHSLTNVTH